MFLIFKQQTRHFVTTKVGIVESTVAMGGKSQVMFKVFAGALLGLLAVEVILFVILFY